ncbi:hypothetical protein NKJ87_02065 [Mesorhizobium sp. M0027]|uniref:hypothetical protein n=1 Tax=unclassified Mesorhizobium TaxID=325217 RepID=UPI0003CE1AA7|nr:hypothetical protein [Mesorhizobium sp. LSHC420B00]ESX78826.1 hypothetical protein X759_14290 [Mesorhizobium sp. LSHC420B00]
MDLSVIASGYSALTAAFEIAKGLKNVDDQVKLNAAVIELQQKIADAQHSASASRDAMRELQEKIAEFERWEKTADRYLLKDFGDQTYAYELIAGKPGDEPSHLVCPNCFQQRKRSILQYDDKYSGRRRYNCMNCGKHVDLGRYEYS